MEIFLKDYVVNNTYKSKKTVKKCLANLESVFGESFSLELTQESIAVRKQTIETYKKILKKLLE